MLSWANPRFNNATLSLAAAKQRTFDRITQRSKSPRVAGNDHLAERVEQHQAVRAVEALRNIPHHIHKCRPSVSRQLAANLVHDDFGVGIARQMMIIVRQQFIAELRVICELAVERETEPLVLLQVLPLERLRVVQVVLPTRGISNMTDRRTCPRIAA